MGARGRSWKPGFLADELRPATAHALTRLQGITDVTQLATLHPPAPTTDTNPAQTQPAPTLTAHHTGPHNDEKELHP